MCMYFCHFSNARRPEFSKRIINARILETRNTAAPSVLRYLVFRNILLNQQTTVNYNFSY